MGALIPPLIEIAFGDFKKGVWPTCKFCGREFEPLPRGETESTCRGCGAPRRPSEFCHHLHRRHVIAASMDEKT